MSTRMSSDTSIARDRGDALRKLLASRITGQMATGIAEFPRVWTVPNFVPTTEPYGVLLSVCLTPVSAHTCISYGELVAFYPVHLKLLILRAGRIRRQMLYPAELRARCLRPGRICGARCILILPSRIHSREAALQFRNDGERRASFFARLPFCRVA
jgi:hypothetical protein